MENGDFYEGSLTAGKEYLSYNTKSEEETGNIKTIINSISEEYLEKLEVIKGELVINTTDKKEIKLAQNLGIEVNPYDITDGGELLSSDGNLLLMDENGTLTIPDRVTSIGEGAFSGLEGLKKIIIPGTVKEIKANAFSNNQDIEEVIIEDGVEKIGKRAFINCSKLQRITLPDTITSIGEGCFKGNEALDNVKLPDNLTILDSQTFQNCTNLKNLEFSENLETLRDECLQSTNLTKIKLSPNLRNISSSALQISTLEEIDTTENNYYTFKDGILYSKDLKDLIFAIPSLASIDIDSSTEKISACAFSQCSKLNNINITENINTIGVNVFNTNLKSITVDEKNKYFKTDEKNNLYSIDGKNLYRLFDKGEVIIKDGVEIIVRGALPNNGTIKTITLPESFTGDYISSYWGTFPTLDYLYLPKNVKVFYPDAYFRVNKIEVSDQNPNLKSIDDEYILSKDGSELYWVSKEKMEINMPSTVKNIKDRAFYYSKAEKIKLPENVEEIGNYILASSNIKEIEIQSKIKTISSQAFTNASNLAKVIINKNKNEISGSPWGNPYGERAIYWKDSE